MCSFSFFQAGIDIAKHTLISNDVFKISHCKFDLDDVKPRRATQSADDFLVSFAPHSSHSPHRSHVRHIRHITLITHTHHRPTPHTIPSPLIHNTPTRHMQHTHHTYKHSLNDTYNVQLNQDCGTINTKSTSQHTYGRNTVKFTQYT